MSYNNGFQIAGRLKRHRRFLKTCLLILCFSALALLTQREAQGVDIEHQPMEAASTSAAPNIMFVLDNSGSMDWTFMTQENDGKFDANGNKEYVFDDPGDNTYSGDILSGDNRGYYKAQCSGYNKIYYSPQAVYDPWPSTPTYTFSDADINKPSSNPISSSDTLTLAAEYWTTSFQSITVVDNSDSGFSRSATGWSLGQSGTLYGPDYLFSGADSLGDPNYSWARWTPNIPFTGEYEVFVWWREETSRHTDIEYDIHHNAGDNAVNGFDQQSDGGLWHSLGKYDFDAGQSGYVDLKSHIAGTSKYSADAMKFERVGGTISIKNAHYYTWDDTNTDGVMDAGETVYLVNFNDPDGNKDYGDVERRYYRVVDDGDAKVEATELMLIEELPDHLKSAVYDLDGNFDHYRTDEEDLQNFANWYSYYRRRELTAKAAVSNTIVDIEGAYVGLYTLHPTDGNNVGVRQTVLPIKLNAVTANGGGGGGANIILDEDSSRYSESDSWKNTKDEKVRYTINSGKWARWTPNIIDAGEYKVKFAIWKYNKKLDENALYTVQHSGGTNTFRVNQRVNNKDWFELGTFKFDAGTSGYVMVTRDGSSTGKFTFADQVMFEPVAAAGPATLVYQDETNTLLDQLYKIESADGTPLREAVDNVGRYYHADDDEAGNLSKTAPWAACEDGGACQKSFCIAMTDGYWNGSTPSNIGNQDSGLGAPYQDSYSDTLADVVMKYYKNDLSTSLDNTVAPAGCDQATHQHMTTYSVSFGVIGTLDPDDYDYYGDDPCLQDHTPGGASGWPKPTSGDQEKIDDLWHAAVNGRGQFFSASSPAELVASLKAIAESVEQSVSSGASVSVNGEELSQETVLYQARYKSADWTGEVIAREINPKTRIISTEELWNASEKLQELLNPSDDRKIVTFDASSSSVIKFQASDLQNYQKLALDPGNDTTLIANLVDYLRGDEVTGMRARSTILGDIVHSSPVFVSSYGPANNDGIDNDDDGYIDEALDTDPQKEWEWKKQATLYAGGNDGMLHAFNAEDGTERFAYIPNLLFEETENDPTLGVVSRLRFLAATDYEHRFFVDNTASFKEISRDSDIGVDNDGDGMTDERITDGKDNDSDGRIDELDELEISEVRTLVVGGLGYGGKGYYGLTVRKAVQTGGVWSESFNADSWDFLDTSITESTIAANLLAWEYPPNLDTLNSDLIDNDGDGLTDEGKDTVDNDGDGDKDEADEYEIDADMGYSYSSAYIVKSFSIDHPWVVIFGNGYNSDSGEAVLYVLDAFDGSLVRKIHTECGPSNGLSSPALVALTTKESLIKWNTEGSDGIDNDSDGSIDEADEFDNDEDGDVDEGTDGTDNNSDGKKDEGPFDNLDNDGDGYVDEADSQTPELGEWEKASMALDDIVAFAYAGDLKGNLWKFDLSSPDPADWDVSYKCRNGQDCNADGTIDASDIVDNPQPLFQTVGQPITIKPAVMKPCKYGLSGHMVIFGTGKYLDMDDRDSSAFTTQTLYGIWDYGDSYDSNKGNATNYYDDGEYLGSLDRTTGRLSNFDDADNVKLLKQEELDPPDGWITYTDMHGNSFDLRLSTDNDASYVGVPDKNSVGLGQDPDGHDWGSDGIDNDGDGDTDEDLCSDNIDNDNDGDTDEADECDCGGSSYGLASEKCGTWAKDGLDNDNDGDTDEADEEVSHVGWYFDLPGFGDKAAAGVRYGERVIEDVIIRGGVLIAITSAPIDTPCSGGGESLVMELDACTGGSLPSAQFDINGDGKVDADDMINIGTEDDPVWVAPSAKLFQGLLQPPVILKKPGGGDLKVLSDSSGGTQTIDEEGEGENFQYWQELSVLP